ncbi:hypothetical protein MASR1M31_03250 [Porphyromonadaceae bacterium]
MQGKCRNNDINMSFFDRLDIFIESKGLNDNKITVITGISNGLIGKARKKDGTLSVENISKILFSFPDLNADWLITGRGKMTLSDEFNEEQYPADELKRIKEEYQWLKKRVENQELIIETLVKKRQDTAEVV